jgi:hypothetical protein
MIVKALDASGEPLLRKGHQVYKHVDYATSAERAFWNNENKVRLKSGERQRKGIGR